MGLVNYLGISSLSLFVAPVVEKLGVTSTAFLLCATTNSLGGVFGATLGGRLLDQKGLRFTGTGGAVLIAVGFLLLSMAKTMPLFYISYFITGFAASGTGTIFINKMAATWFRKYRGTVTGICAAGQSTFTLLLATVIAGRIQTAGYAGAYRMMAVIMAAAAVLLAVFLREKPEDMGQYPDGIRHENAENKPNIVLTGFTASEALKTSAFWLILIGFAFNTMASLGVMQTYIAHFQSIGYTAILAATAASVYGFFGIFSRIAWGRLADMFNHRGCWITSSIIFSGTIFYLSTLTQASGNMPLYIFGVAYAIGNGAGFILMAKFVSYNFGTKAFGTLNGYIMTAMMLGGMLGGPLAGMIYDRTGSYRVAYLLFTVLGVAAMLLAVIAKKTEKKKIKKRN